MSVDIDWTLLTPSLAEGLVTALNTQLNAAARPSFLGPITVTSFDFGTAAPSVEIKDVRDVWRAFDEADDEGDAMVASAGAEEGEEEEAEYGEYGGVGVGRRASRDGRYGRDRDYRDREGRDYRDRGREYDDGYAAYYAPGSYAPSPGAYGYAPPPSAPGQFGGHGGHYSVHSAGLGGGLGMRPMPGRSRPASVPPQSGVANMPAPDADDDENDSVYSGFASGRNSVASVGIGLGALGLRRRLAGMGTPPRRPASGLGGVGLGGGGGGWGGAIAGLGDSRERERPPSWAPRGPGTRAPASAPVSPPPSPPRRPAGPPPRANPLPSVQLHLRVEHTADIGLTLLTSLQVNYPSALFMALPLKLVITGLTFTADVVVAYSGAKHRLHVSIVDDPDEHTKHPPQHPGTREPAATTVGQRILPHLQIESEIGSADAHVLRNVGKVERFIVDVVRKMLVNELVFPNFHTIVL